MPSIIVGAADTAASATSTMADYGTAIFAIAAVALVMISLLKYLGHRNTPQAPQHTDYSEEMKLLISTNNKVLENNTKAMESVASIVRSLELGQARQETMLKELCDRGRHAGGVVQ